MGWMRYIEIDGEFFCNPADALFIKTEFIALQNRIETLKGVILDEILQASRPAVCMLQKYFNRIPEE